MARTLGSMMALLLALGAGTASAQTQDEEAAGASTDGDYGGPAPSTPLTVRDANDPHEEANTDYFFIGAFYRHVIIPGFIQQLFVDGGIDGSNPGVGLTFNWRKNDFNVIANVWWNNAEASGYFRALGDPRTDTEFIQAHMGVVFVNAEFMWSFPITDWLAFELGFDLGFGFIYGGLTRTEAYESRNASGTGQGDWQACNDVGNPNAEYCEGPRLPPETCWANPGGHYQCTEPNWTTRDSATGDTGQVPVIFPWISLPHLAIRIKPIRQVQIRIDGGYGLYNFFFGGAVSYGF